VSFWDEYMLDAEERVMRPAVLSEVIVFGVEPKHVIAVIADVVVRVGISPVKAQQ